MKRSAANVALAREIAKIKELSIPGIKNMMQTGTLTATNIEMMSLELAAFYGFTLVMQMLLTTGEADVNRVNSKTGDTALHWAVRAEQVEMIGLLQKYGAVSKANKRQETPEKIAQMIQNEVIQKCLGSFQDVEEDGIGAELVGVVEEVDPAE